MILKKGLAHHEMVRFHNLKAELVGGMVFLAYRWVSGTLAGHDLHISVVVAQEGLDRQGQPIVRLRKKVLGDVSQVPCNAGRGVTWNGWGFAQVTSARRRDELQSYGPVWRRTSAPPHISTMAQANWSPDHWRTFGPMSES